MDIDPQMDHVLLLVFYRSRSKLFLLQFNKFSQIENRPNSDF